MVKIVGSVILAAVILGVAVWSWWWENAGTDTTQETANTPSAEEQKKE
ncbi:MAG: hypothetical protein J1E62_00295 [Lachnospiraceae bacterium]|nr:hypothetical protein [Lachnospiraceae bacterium]